MLPVTGTASLAFAVVFGAAFGFLLHRGRVADYNTIVRQFLFRDFTVIKIMLTAIIIGGIVYALSYDWIVSNILPVGAMGKVQLPQLLGVSAATLFAALAVAALVLFSLIERHARKMR